MFRVILGIFAVLLGVSGCTMCCHPYDYSGPVYDDGYGNCSSWHSRSGSILDGSYAMESPRSEPTPSPAPSTGKLSNHGPGLPESALVKRREHVAGQSNRITHAMGRDVPRISSSRQPTVDPQMQTLVRGDMRPGDVAGSERILSVTERVVDSSPANPSESSLAAQDSAAVPTQPLPTAGWTARRSDADALR